MTTKFDKQLKELLSQDISSDIDNLDDEEDGGTEYEEFLPITFEEKESNLTIEDNEDLNNDYKFARSNFYGLIGRTNSAIDLTLKIAALSEHPRAMEVAANLMKTSADITKDLLALQKTILSSNKKENDKEDGKYVQNNHYYNDKQSSADIEKELDSLDDS